MGEFTHTLNGVLVDISSFTGDRNSIIMQARRAAEDGTEEFYDRVFDWRETDSAGRWSSKYPENVILGTEKPDDLLEAVLELKTNQKNAMFHHLNEIRKISCDIDVIFQNMLTENDAGFNMTAYHFRKLGQIASAEYTVDSYFYNTIAYNSKITDELMDDIKANPSKYAIVMFDYHF